MATQKRICRAWRLAVPNPFNFRVADDPGSTRKLNGRPSQWTYPPLYGVERGSCRSFRCALNRSTNTLDDGCEMQATIELPRPSRPADTIPSATSHGKSKGCRPALKESDTVVFLEFRVILRPEASDNLKVGGRSLFEQPKSASAWRCICEGL